MLAYSRLYGLIKAKDDIIDGQMAAVGLSKEEIVNLLPKNIYIACENSRRSVTISGPIQNMNVFIEELKSKNIFVRTVATGNYALHTKYINPAVPYLLEFMKQIHFDPKPRSPKWISTSVSADQTTESWTKYNCVEYHCNNFQMPVLFDKVYEHIPENALVIEVSPRALLLPIMKREYGPNVINFGIVDKNASNNEHYLFSIIGK